MQTLIKGLALATVIGFGMVAFDGPQDAKAKQDAKAAEGGVPAPEVTPEHKWLAEGEGKWKAVGKHLAGPDTWVPMTGVQTNTIQQGGLWQMIDFKDDTGGFVGHGVGGFDPLKKKFVSVWVDNMGTEFSPAEGTLNADKTVLTMEFTKNKARMTEVLTRKDKNTLLFEMFTAGPDGKPMKVLEINYTRM